MSAIAGATSGSDHGSDEPTSAHGPGARVENSVTGDRNTIYQVGTYTVHQATALAELGTRHEVPPPIGEFFDREAPLACLDDAASAPGVSVRIVVLAGPPGIGRRSVSRYWVHSRRLGPPLPSGQPFTAAFPGGEFHIDLTAGRHVTTEEVLRQLLVATGVRPDFVPPSLAERARLFRSRTASRPVIMVIDGVREHGQVLGLVPGCPGSVMLVVPHRQDRLSDLAGARLVRLEPFDVETAARMLASACGAERVRADPEAVATLVRLCGGLPLGVSLAARHLAAHPSLSVASLVRRWAAPPLDTVRLTNMARPTEVESPMTGLDVVYQSLPVATARAYRRIGLMPGEIFDETLLAAALEQTVEESAQIIRSLADSGLVEETHHHWWRLHELIRPHARARAHAEDTEQERHAVLDRLARHLRDGAIAADEILFPDAYRPHRLAEPRQAAPPPTMAATADERRRDALRWLDERRDLALSCMRENSRRCDLDRAVWQLASAYTSLFLHRRHVSAWARMHEFGADAARRTGAADAEAWLRCMRSRPLTDQGALGIAGAELERARTLAQGSANLVLRASVQEFYGRHLDRTGDRPAAWAAFETCRALNLAAGERRGAALADFFEGCSRDAAGDHARAISLLREAEAAFSTRGDPRMAARAQLALGVATARSGRPGEAEPQLRDAARRLAELDAPHYAAEAHELLAALAEQAGDLVAMDVHLRALLAIHVQAGDDLKVTELRARLDHLERARSTQNLDG